MAAGIGHSRAPEVVLEERRGRMQGQHILVHRDRRDVVVHEIAIQSVPVANNGDYN